MPPRRADSPPDRGFRKIGAPAAAEPGRPLRAHQARQRADAQPEEGGLSWAWISTGFVVGLGVPVLLAAWAPPPPTAQALFDVVTSIVKRTPDQWGCDQSADPKACDEWLECAKMQEVARVGSETAESVINFRPQRVLASALLCSQQLIGGCGSLWLPVNTSLLGATFAKSDAARESSWLCRQVLQLAAVARRLRPPLPAVQTASSPKLTQADLDARAEVALTQELEALRQKFDEEGGELVFKRDGESSSEDGEIDPLY